jgi:hypothetical protein
MELVRILSKQLMPCPSCPDSLEKPWSDAVRICRSNISLHPPGMAVELSQLPWHSLFVFMPRSTSLYQVAVIFRLHDRLCVIGYSAFREVTSRIGRPVITASMLVHETRNFRSMPMSIGFADRRKW